MLVSGLGPSGRNWLALPSASGRIPGRQSPSTGAGPGLPDAGPRGGQAEVRERGGAPTAVVRAQRHHCLGGLLTDRDSVRLRRAVRDRTQVGGVVGVEDRLAGAQLWLETGERVVRRGRDRGLGRGAGRGCRRGRVRLVAAR